jgi:two-component system, cell cycle sensor histidine kinase and response regulator CckA
MLNIFPEPCFLINTDGFILKSNTAFAARFSKSVEECLGLNVFDLLSINLMIPEIAEQRRKKIEEVIRTGKQLSFEDAYNERIHRHTVYPLRSLEGAIENLLIIAQDITDIKRSELIGEYEQAFRKAVIDTIPGTFYLLDADFRLAGWNASLRDEIIGKPESEMTDTDVLDIIHPDDRAIIQQKMMNVLNHGVEERAEVRVFLRGGPEICWRLMTGKKIILNGASFLIGTGIDITERKRAENQLQKLNRAHLAISNCNQVLLYAHNEKELLQEICRIVVDIGGYRMAWVGYAQDDEAKTIRPVAQAGIEEGYLDTLFLSWADTERGHSPTGTAIRTCHPCSICDLQSDPEFQPWLMEATARGYASVLSLPLKTGEKAFGALTMYSAIQDSFNAEETKLLTALADNLAYGITMLQTRTARDEAEDALRQSEALYRSRFQNLHTVMLIIDPENGMLVDANPAAVSFYGWDRDELCQKKISQITLLRESEVTFDMELLTNKENNGFIFRHCRADGSVRDVEVFCAPIIIQGRPLYYAVVHDITERIRHETLAAFRQRLIQMAESHSVEELLRLTLDEAEKCTASKIGFYHFLGENQLTNSLHVASSNVHQKMPGVFEKLQDSTFPDRALWTGFIQGTKAVITNENNTGETFGDFSASHPKITRTMAVPILEGDKVAGVLWVGNKPDAYVDDDIKSVRIIADIAQDIVFRKLAEQSQQEMQSSMIQFQKMELVGQLAGGIANDFNNMLGVIIGNIEMAMYHKQSLEEPLQNNLKNILKVATRSADLVSQLLTLARKQTVMPLILELNTVIENMLVVLRRLIGENITIVWIPCEHRTLVKVDPTQIDQILVNLCINSRDAIAGIGKIIIETGQLCDKKSLKHSQHSCKISGDYVTLSVTDNGCGIEKEHLPHIFEPFFTTKDSGTGTGLGLSTVYGIVKQNKGCIDCWSEPGQGSTVKIHLPRHKGGYAATDDSEQAPPLERQSNETILIVENEYDVLILCKVALEDAGYTVLSATTPHEAIRLAGQYKGVIDLLLTDVVMPEMNGCDLSKQLQSVAPGIKTLYMSGYSSDIISNNEAITEAINFIQKPFSLKTLTKTVKNIINRFEP